MGTQNKTARKGQGEASDSVNLVQLTGRMMFDKVLGGAQRIRPELTVDQELHDLIGGFWEAAAVRLYGEADTKGGHFESVSIGDWLRVVNELMAAEMDRLGIGSRSPQPEGMES